MKKKTKAFRFKQFSIIQENSAMKVGTDGVLLGAWVEAKNPKNILDIGTGTGLLTLMLAQRFPDAHVKGIEIDENSAAEALSNIKQSKFFARCEIENISLQNFNSDIKFDFIVSNPPFFGVNKSSPEESRKNARQQSLLSFEELISSTKKLLSENGETAFVIPYFSENEFIEKAKQNNLYLKKLTRVKGNANSEIKRSLLCFSQEENQKAEKNELIIENSRHNYTKEYIELTKDFYLNM